MARGWAPHAQPGRVLPLIASHLLEIRYCKYSSKEWLFFFLNVTHWCFRDDSLVCYLHSTRIQPISSLLPRHQLRVPFRRCNGSKIRFEAAAVWVTFLLQKTEKVNHFGIIGWYHFWYIFFGGSFLDMFGNYMISVILWTPIILGELVNSNFRPVVSQLCLKSFTCWHEFIPWGWGYLCKS